MEQLATGDEVAAIVGPYTSANANAVAKLAEQYKVPQVIPAAAKEEITKQGYKYVFRLNAPAHQYAQSLLDAALSLGKPKTHRLHLRVHRLRQLRLRRRQGLREEEGAADRRRRGLPEGRRRLPLHPHEDEGGEPGPRLHGLLRRRRHPPHAAVARGGAQAPGVPRRRRRLRHRPVREREGHLDERLLGHAVDARDRSPGATEFADRYQAKFGKKPTYHAACAYAAMMIVGEVAAKAGGDREKIRAGARHGLAGPGSWAT